MTALGSLFVRAVIQNAAESAGVTASELLAKGRNPGLVRARQRAMVELHNLGYSYSEIGVVFERDHSAVRWAVSRATREDATEPPSGLETEATGQDYSH